MAIAFGEAWQLYVWPAHAPRPTLPQLQYAPSGSWFIVVVEVLQASNPCSSTGISMPKARAGAGCCFDWQLASVSAHGGGSSGPRW